MDGVSRKRRPQSEAFEAALQTWLSTRGRSRAAAERQLKRHYRQAWTDPRETVRTGVLIYLTRARPADGTGMVLAGLRSKRESVRVHALSTAGSYIRAGHALQAPQRAAIERIAERDPNQSVRLLAMYTLIRVGDPESGASLRRIARDDPSSGLRLEANLELLRRGHKDGLRALFQEYRTHPHTLQAFPEARQVFDRVGMSLTRSEEQRLDRLATKAVDGERARLRDTTEDETERAMSALFLSRHSTRRYPVRAVEVDIIGRLALGATTTKAGVIAVNALGGLTTPRTKRWLRAITKSSQSSEVARRAKTFLR